MATRTLPLFSLLLLLASFSALPMLAKGDIQCTQYGSDTFRVNSTIKFLWNDTGTVPIDTFKLDLYCFENQRLMQTLATLNATSSVSPQTWVVDSTIMTTLAECPLNQYQGAFDWTYTDPNTGVLTSGSSFCKTMLLVGTGVTPAPGTVTDPSDAFPTDDPTSGPIEISNRTKSIVIGVGCAVGALVLAGFVGFYFIRYKNTRAEQDLASSKLREPLQSPNGYDGSNDDGGHGAGFAATAAGAGVLGLGPSGRYNELPSVATSVAGGYSPVATRPGTDLGEMVEMNGLAAPSALTRDSYSSNSRPQSYGSGSGTQSPTPVSANHSRNLAQQQQQRLSSPGSFTTDRPPSLLTSPFVPPPDDRLGRMRFADQDQEPQQQQKILENERLQYEQQLQHQQQQQQAHLQQQQQQQQQLNYGSYY
ncbi:hypothetical protein EDD21DRAFT_355729 [Dissophora ornata]|nr:hypothetical protein EDD21DRAFT_355729 [Dissophora ornata]